jgi:hypothetical protein
MESRETERFGLWFPRTVAVVARIVLWRPSARAIFRFTVLSLFRNGRPLLVVATYFGLGLALSGIRLTSAVVRGRPLPLDAPYDYLLAVPLVLAFALSAGVRSAFAAPIELPANWSFRLMAGAGTAACANATRAVLMVVGVLPVSVAVLGGGAVLWGWRSAAAVAVMHAASGLVLSEVLTLGCRAVPFARARGVDPTSIRVGAPLALIGLHLFAFRLDDLQRVALGVPSAVATYVGMAILAVVALRIYDSWRARPRGLTFEVEEEAAIRQLGLSGSSG